jgi:hypothetical protein
VIQPFAECGGHGSASPICPRDFHAVARVLSMKPACTALIMLGVI